jgi:hypothetical protein
MTENSFGQIASLQNLASFASCTLLLFRRSY